MKGYGRGSDSGIGISEVGTPLGWLDAVVVGTPGDDGLLDGFGFQVLSEGAVGEGREFGVGGEAEGDELAGGEFGDVDALIGGEERGKTKALFEADDAVLRPEGRGAGDSGDEDEDDGHDDGPEMGVEVGVAVMNGDVDGEAKVDEKQWHDGEVEERVEAGVVLETLSCGH
jgi:hypothetical protein